MRLNRILALLMSILMLVAMPLAAIAETVVSETTEVNEVVSVNGIDLSETVAGAELSTAEVAAYTEIAETIAASEEDSVTVEAEDGAAVTYTLENYEEGTTVLTAVETTVGEGAISVATVSEIVLTAEVVEDETAEDEVVEDETTEGEVVEDETTEDEVVEDETTEGEVVEDETTEDEVVEDETTEDEVVEDETTEDETTEDEVVEDETTEDEVVEDETSTEELQVPEKIEEEFGEMDEIHEEIYQPEADVEGDALAILTMEELLAGLGGNMTEEELAAYKTTSEYQMYVDFAGSVGLGRDVDVIVSELQEIAAEYAENKAAYDAYLAAKAAYDEAVANGDTTAVAPEVVEEPTVPMYSLEDLTITLDKEVTESGSGYITEITVNADAVYNVQYDGKVEVEVEVPYDGGTDFVITLDVSGSMDGTADKAMLQALKKVMEEIMANDQNTVSIVFYGQNAGALKLDMDGDGVMESVFEASKYTLNDIFNAKLAGTGKTLNELINGNYAYPLREVRNAYNLSSSATSTSYGLDAAYDLLSELYGGAKNPDDRNTGVLLFTDGAANNPGSAEERTIISERKLVSDFGATVVNVALGTSTSYEDYMNPENKNYKYNENNGNSIIKNDYSAENELLLKENVVYYNIPKVSNDELAKRISDMFDVAFKTITTEKQQLTSGTITDGVLAAIESNLVDTIPATMEIVRIEGETPSYKVLGKDENGNTLIAWEIGNLYSGDELTFSYFMVPVDGKTDLKVDIATGVDTVLVTNPMDKVLNNDENTQIALVHCVEPYTAADSESNATLPKTGDTTVPAVVLVMGMILSMAGFVAAKRYA